MSYKIVEKEEVATDTFKMVFEAPDIAAAAKAGQFLIVRIDERGERIPLTIADFSSDENTVTTVIQALGKSTKKLTKMNVGESISDIAGPLGTPADVKQLGTVVLVGGGVGIAPIYPQISAYKNAGNRVVSIIGARNKDLLFWEERVKDASDEYFVATDDGSKGHHGFVTEVLKNILDEEKEKIENKTLENPKIKRVVVIGPPILMKVATQMMNEYPDVEIIVSMNTMMVDGTGMCGGCRLIVDGKVKFSCVDGPEFDGRLVDFNTVMNRLTIYKREEIERAEKYKKECEGGVCSTLD
ncbi:MAG: sulfide/dihydroorotate dehydrogenase-like FAD/NAD-binding protein [Methanosarcinaceae archaeon]|nr:sulfide/dihydroorotate dehydrogenase-like FAD/NAD-binding protein [Methanosarcinaceae archaeon]